MILNHKACLEYIFVNSLEFPPAKALATLALLSYLQAFEDGNKRTARLVSTAILLAYDYCPLSCRSVPDFDYTRSMIIFYEINNIYYLKDLFKSQFEFAVKTYFAS